MSNRTNATSQATTDTYRDVPAQHMTEKECLRRVMEATVGRWASLYELVERIAPQDMVLRSLVTIGNDTDYIVRKRDTDKSEDDRMFREYRTFAYGCEHCANRIETFHKPTCPKAGTLVRQAECKEW